MNRRSFLTACIATMSAPAIVRASSLMPVSVKPWQQKPIILTQEFTESSRIYYVGTVITTYKFDFETGSFLKNESKNFDLLFDESSGLYLTR